MPLNRLDSPTKMAANRRHLAEKRWTVLSERLCHPPLGGAACTSESTLRGKATRPPTHRNLHIWVTRRSANWNGGGRQCAYVRVRRVACHTLCPELPDQTDIRQRYDSRGIFKGFFGKLQVILVFCTIFAIEWVFIILGGYGHFSITYSNANIAKTYKMVGDGSDKWSTAARPSYDSFHRYTELGQL